MPTVPDPILHKLRCANCRNWLSYGPVRLLPNGGSICGRCDYAGPIDQYRHFAFEALACYFMFPCIYWEKHCDALIPFKKVPEHERKCSYDSNCSLFCSRPSVLCKSKRNLNLKSVVNLEIIPDQVLEYLRCSNCAGYLSCMPVYVCRDGTSICHRCNTQIPQPSNEFIRDIKFELFVDMMIFPCIFRYRGCTYLCKFGEEMMEHEFNCPYGQVYTREERHSKQEVPQKPEPPPKPEPHGKQHKERGVIKTISGHIYATITPNAPLFSPIVATNKHQEIFLDEFQKHRDNLASKWGHNETNQHYYNQDPEYPQAHSSSRTESSYANLVMNPSLIDELKIKQQLRNSFRDNDFDSHSKAYYNKQADQRKYDYSVYS